MAPSRSAGAVGPALLLAVLLSGGCQASGATRRALDDASVADLNVAAGEDAAGPCDDRARPCPSGERCLAGACIPDNGACDSDEACQNDSHCLCTGGGGGDGGACLGGVCVPWSGTDPGFDPGCGSTAFGAAAFEAPVVKCQWTDVEHNDYVLTTPLVLDLDGDRRPEILFTTYRGTLVAIHGDTCQELWRLQVERLSQGSDQIAAADLDADGHPEIVVPGIKHLSIVSHVGKVVAQAEPPVAGLVGGPTIADVDGVAPPEIGIGGAVYRFANRTLKRLWIQPVTPASWGVMSLFADLDGDGRPELVSGLEVYDGVTGKDETPSNLRALGAPGAYPAVADFNGDGKPDLALVQSDKLAQRVSVFDVAANRVIFGPFTVTGGGWGGTPTVADFDGDHVPDIGLASNEYYYVYALRCAAKVKPVDCTGTDPGVLWQRKAHDFSSGGCGSSTFDFNGDGINEVVYRDECWLRVLNGPDGKTVFAAQVSSGTGVEYPVVADVDGDGHADIVVPSDSIVDPGQCAGDPEGQLNQLWTTPTEGVLVFGDPRNRWVPSRSLWHQHAYHITEIGDDLRVPTQEVDSWKSWNTYRTNIEGEVAIGQALADYTGAIASGTGIDNGGQDCAVTERLWASVCNRGTATVPRGVPGTFYDSDPRRRGVAPVCTAATSAPLAPGHCEPVHCDRSDPPATPQDLWFRANDDGAAPGSAVECKHGNNLLFLPRYTCRGIG